MIFLHGGVKICPNKILGKLIVDGMVLMGIAEMMRVMQKYIISNQLRIANKTFFHDFIMIFNEFIAK